MADLYPWFREAVILKFGVSCPLWGLIACICDQPQGSEHIGPLFFIYRRGRELAGGQVSGSSRDAWTPEHGYLASGLQACRELTSTYIQSVQKVAFGKNAINPKTYPMQSKGSWPQCHTVVSQSFPTLLSHFFLSKPLLQSHGGFKYQPTFQVRKWNSIDLLKLT